MMLLRLLSLAAGALVLVAPAILFPSGTMVPDAGKAGLALACVVLAATGFFVVGMAGRRLRRSPPLRTLAALLLAVPLVASLILLANGGSPVLLTMAGATLGLSMVLYPTMVLRFRSGSLRRPRSTAH